MVPNRECEQRLVDVSVCLCVYGVGGEYIPALKPACLQIRLVHRQYPSSTIPTYQTPTSPSTYSSILLFVLPTSSYSKVDFVSLRVF